MDRGYPRWIGRDYHATRVAGSSPNIESQNEETIPLGLYEKVIGRGNELYPGQTVNVWADGQRRKDAKAMEVIPLEEDEISADLTVSELELFLRGMAVIPGEGHEDDYHWPRIDDRIEHNTVQKVDGVLSQGEEIYITDPASEKIINRFVD